MQNPTGTSLRQSPEYSVTSGFSGARKRGRGRKALMPGQLRAEGLTAPRLILPPSILQPLPLKACLAGRQALRGSRQGAAEPVGGEADRPWSTSNPLNARPLQPLCNALARAFKAVSRPFTNHSDPVPMIFAPLQGISGLCSRSRNLWRPGQRTLLFGPENQIRSVFS